MKTIFTFLSILMLSSTTAAAGQFITYEVNGAPYEGYYARATANAPVILLIHDWDGLTDYEVKRAEMLVKTRLDLDDVPGMTSVHLLDGKINVKENLYNIEKNGTVGLA